MKDRVSLYPGRVKLTPVSGQENTYDMVRADEPTQEGTPLNKATLLKDSTAALFGLDENAVPDDAFVKIAMQLSESFQIVLLWENASPSSSFRAQTINLDLSDYSHVLIKYKIDTTSVAEEMHSLFMVLESEAVRQSVYPGTGYQQYRNCYVTKTGIRFNDAQKGIYNGSFSANNTLQIPWKIYGVKGVQSS